MNAPAKKPRAPRAPSTTQTGRADRLPARAARVFPIVGVGASAGGLEAFTLLLNHLPSDTGFGFVLVQHLDPQHESALAHLLARATTMPVHEATNRRRVQPNHVYIIPPNSSLGIARGVLHLRPRAENCGAHKTIDLFFEALAKDRRARAIGVILSGTATDGTVGLAAIKAAGGLTFAQDDSARHPSMPRHAAASGCVDRVLPPETIARELARIARHPPAARRPRHPPAPPPPAAPAPQGFAQILRLLRQHSGVDFTHYKPSTILRRIQRRTRLSQQATPATYAAFLAGNTQELDALYADVLINVTSFFRNPAAFELLQRKVFPQLLQARGDEPVRLWVLGCSTGQEAYSLAIAYAEVAAKTPQAPRLQIFATDLNEANLTRARRGSYPKSLTRDLSPERLRRFFTEEAGGYRVIKPLRELVVFARQDVISDPPFSRMDLISCRNLLIYLEPGLQEKVFPNFHYALEPGGFLLLGASESIGRFTELFTPLDKRQKLFAKQPASTPAFQLPGRPLPGRPAPSPPPGPFSPNSPPATTGEPPRGDLGAERAADRVTINRFAPPGVLINARLQILQFRGATGAFLEPPTGKASFDLLKMARDGLLLPLRATIERASKTDRPARAASVSVHHEGQTHTVDLEVVPLPDPQERCFLVVFAATAPPLATAAPAPAPRAGPSRLATLQRELAETRDYLRAVQEAQETATAELQSANEEGQSANEELQSLNEELETSKEELESTNEELTTVNEEMVIRNAELNRLNNDLTNLETSTNLAIVLLHRDLTIRRFSSRAAEQFNLHAADVGRAFGAVRHQLQLTGLEALLARVVASGRPCEREVRTTAGRWFALRVRPYLNASHQPEGAVLVLVDIDDLKRTERLISEEHEHAAAIIRTVPDPLVILTADLRLQSANESFYRSFKVTPRNTTGRLIYELDRGSWNIPALRRLLEDILPRNRFFDDFEVTHRFARLGRRSLLLNARLLQEPGGTTKEILLGIHDITARKLAEEALAGARTDLARHAGQLEKQVAARTAALTAANRRLAAAVRSSTQGKEEYRQLLGEAQHMHKKLRQLTHQILTAQEEERKKISRELHDEVVQTLVGINVELSALVHGNSSGVRRLRDKIAHTQRLVEKSVEAVHRFARDLRPAVLDDLGLIPALHAFCTDLASRKKLKIKLRVFRGIEQLDSAKRTVLYRVAQEALTNIARHARATQAEVHLRRVAGAVRLEIRDNGRSFSVQQILRSKRQKRLGLVGTRERVEMVGGTLTLESTPGVGTVVRATLPFPPVPN